MIKYRMLDYPISSPFGHTGGLHRVPHSGMDIATPAGTPAQSLTGGIVESVTTNDQFLGASVRVDADNGQEWVYGHLSKVDAIQGQTVSAGDVLGLTGGVPGTPGAGLSTGAHIHLTALQGGVPVDPVAALQSEPSFWSKLGDIFTVPGADLAGLTGVPTFGDRVLDFVDKWINMGIQVMPEICVVLAMVFLLGGMTGWRKGMGYAGTCTLLAFVGVILNGAIE